MGDAGRRDELEQSAVEAGGVEATPDGNVVPRPCFTALVFLRPLAMTHDCL